MGTENRILWRHLRHFPPRRTKSYGSAINGLLPCIIKILSVHLFVEIIIKRIHCNQKRLKTKPMTNPPASFREKVLAIVQKIPRGQTLTYKQVAVLAGRPRAYHAAGNIRCYN